MPAASAGESSSGTQRWTASTAASTNCFFASASPATLIPLGRGGPISVPSRLKLKLSVTKEPFEPAGAVQHARIAAPTSSIVLSGAAIGDDTLMIRDIPQTPNDSSNR